MGGVQVFVSSCKHYVDLSGCILLQTVICFALSKLPCKWQISRRDIPLLFTFAEMSQFMHHHVQCTKLGSAIFSFPSPPARYHMPGTCPMWFTWFPCLHNIMAVINKWWNPNMPRCCDVPGTILQPIYWLPGFVYGLCGHRRRVFVHWWFVLKTPKTSTWLGLALNTQVPRCLAPAGGTSLTLPFWRATNP